jgi:hypothetical protein
MVSSRSQVSVFAPPRKLADVRRKLQEFLRAIRWCADGALAGSDEPLFDVWIHEDETAAASHEGTYALSLREIRRADIVLVLHTGEAGSAPQGSPLGICHAELQEAIAARAESVYLVDLLPPASAKTPLDLRFQEFVQALGVFRRSAASEAELRQVASEILQTALARMASRAAHSATRTVDRGNALAWRRLGLVERQARMREALADVLAPGAAPSATAPGALVAELAGERVLLRVDAIPGPTSMAAARELVGQPFLRDHQLAPLLEDDDVAGPVHVIACHRTVTELQAAAMLGSPDSMVISSDFGVYAADHVYHSQLVLLKQCADPGSIAVGVRHLQEWLRESGEGPALLRRAHARRRIIAAIAGELDGVAAPAAPRKGRRVAARA